MSLKYTGDYYKNPDIKINKYLEEQKTSIFYKINEYDRLLLVAPTGSGKTSLFRNNTDDLLKIYDRIIFVFPLLSIQNQLDTEWETNLSLNFNITKSSAVKKFESAKRISSTYRSLNKISHLIGENDLVILDEIHTLFNDNLPSLDEDNRDRIINAIEDVFISKANVVAMSATPQTFISKALGFHPLVVSYLDKSFLRRISIIYTQFHMSFLVLQISSVFDNLAPHEKLVIYFKNKSNLLFFQNYFNNNPISMENSIISGEALRNNEIGFDNFLVDIFFDNRIIFTTNAITTGVSILDANVKKLIIFDVYESDEIVQVASRFRMVFDLDIFVIIDEKESDNSRYSFNKEEMNEINYYFKGLRNKKSSLFNHGVLDSLKLAQKKLSNGRYKGVPSKQLASELKKYPGFEVSVNRNKQTNIDIDLDKVRKSFFASDESILNVRHHFYIFTVDYYDSTDFDKILFDLSSEIDNYKDILTAFSEPKFKNVSKHYFKLVDIIAFDILLMNWNYLNTSNVKNIEVGVIANDIFKLIISDSSYDVSSAEWLKHNFSIIEEVFNQAIKLSRFKQESLQDKFFNNKHLLYIDNKRKILLIPKVVVSIVRSMFKIRTTGKGKKIKSEYFHEFELPSFEKAKDTSDDKLVYSKEGDKNVIYIYDWDKTMDTFVLQKELSKVLVSDEDLIRNITNK